MAIEEHLKQAQQKLSDGNISEAEYHIIQFLHINPDDPVAKEIGKKILNAKQEKKQKNIESVKKRSDSLSSLKCQNCGAQVNIKLSFADQAVCQQCLSVLDTQDGVVKFHQTKKKYKYRSLIRLGMFLKYKNIRYQVVGRSVKNIVGQEWDAEDNKYIPLRWSYDEWVLIGEKKQVLYLSEDKEGFFMSEKIVPKKPSIPYPGDSYIPDLNGESFLRKRIIEKGQIKTFFIEGEFPWEIDINEKVEFSEYKSSKGRSFSIEAIRNDEGVVKEVEFFETKKIDENSLFLDYFEETTELKKHKDIFLKKKKHYHFFIKLFLGLTIFFGLLSVFSIGDGNRVFSDSITLDNNKIDEITKENLIGPIDLQNTGKLHTLQIISNVSGSNDWNWLGLELIKNDTVVNVYQKEFWSASGYDDGYWSESDTKENFRFVLEDTGTYYLRLFGDVGTQAQSIFTVTVYENTPKSKYYTIAFIISVLILIFLFIRKPNKVYNKNKLGTKFGVGVKTILMIVISILAFKSQSLFSQFF